MEQRALVYFFAAVVSCTTPAVWGQREGCDAIFTEQRVSTLIASNYAEINLNVALLESELGFKFRVVCLANSGQRDRYRFASVVAYYTRSSAPTGPQYGQFEFECVNSVWSATSSFLEATVFDRTTLTSTSAAVSANNRTDCGYCLNPTFSSPPRRGDAVNHCNSCTGCSQPLCYITDTNYPTMGNSFTTACCNYYLSDGITCTDACPALSYPDGNRTCVPCSLSCQNGGVLRSDACACNCTGSVVYGGTYCSMCQCQNGGNCSGSVCTCPPGYTGTLCETPSCPTSCPTDYYCNGVVCKPIVSPSAQVIPILIENSSFYVIVSGLVVSLTALAIGGIVSAVSLVYCITRRKRRGRVKKMEAVTNYVSKKCGAQQDQCGAQVVNTWSGPSGAESTPFNGLLYVPCDELHLNSNLGAVHELGEESELASSRGHRAEVEATTRDHELEYSNLTLDLVQDRGHRELEYSNLKPDQGEDRSHRELEYRDQCEVEYSNLKPDQGEDRGHHELEYSNLKPDQDEDRDRREVEYSNLKPDQGQERSAEHREEIPMVLEKVIKDQGGLQENYFNFQQSDFKVGNANIWSNTSPQNEKHAHPMLQGSKHSNDCVPKIEEPPSMCSPLTRVRVGVTKEMFSSDSSVTVVSVDAEQKDAGTRDCTSHSDAYNSKPSSPSPSHATADGGPLRPGTLGCPVELDTAHRQAGSEYEVSGPYQSLRSAEMDYMALYNVAQMKGNGATCKPVSFRKLPPRSPRATLNQHRTEAPFNGIHRQVLVAKNSSQPGLSPQRNVGTEAIIPMQQQKHQQGFTHVKMEYLQCLNEVSQAKKGVALTPNIAPKVPEMVPTGEDYYDIIDMKTSCGSLETSPTTMSSDPQFRVNMVKDTSKSSLSETAVSCAQSCQVGASAVTEIASVSQASGNYYQNAAALIGKPCLLQTVNDQSMEEGLQCKDDSSSPKAKIDHRPSPPNGVALGSSHEGNKASCDKGAEKGAALKHIEMYEAIIADDVEWRAYNLPGRHVSSEVKESTTNVTKKAKAAS